jgi:hypothetical protein
MDMAALQQMMGGGGPTGPPADTAETVYISSLALLKMLKHGKFAAFPTRSIDVSRHPGVSGGETIVVA